MIPAITYTDIIKKLGAFLDKYSGLNSLRILNADSVRGTDLSQLISESETYSPKLSNSFLLFELLENPNKDHFITKGENENRMMAIQSYNFHLMIYGNNSPIDAQRILTIFKNEDLVLNLRDSGIYVDGISPVESINEFINNTLLLRRDLDIMIQVRYQFDNIGDPVEYFEIPSEIISVIKSTK